MKSFKYTKKPLKYVNYFGLEIPVFFEKKNNQDFFRKSVFIGYLKEVMKYIYKYLVDGFIENQIAKWMRRYCKDQKNILEIGTGSGKLIRYINSNQNYIGFDLKILPDAVKK